MMTSTAMVERSSKWAKRQQEKRCLKKMQFKTHPWNDEKCKRLPKGRLRNRENVECIEMYRNVSDRKHGVIQLYMYNSKKWSYTFLYIPIHLIFFAGFGAEVFESPQYVWRLFDQKNAAPWAAIVEIKKFTHVIILDSNFGRCGTMGRSDSNRRGCTSHKTTLLLMLSNHGLVLPQPQRPIEPLLYKLGSGITVLQGCLAASSNSSLLRLMEPHTSQFKVLLTKHEYCVFDTVSKTSSKHNSYSSNKNLENV